MKLPLAISLGCVTLLQAQQGESVTSSESTEVEINYVDDTGAIGNAEEEEAILVKPAVSIEELTQNLKKSEEEANEKESEGEPELAADRGSIYSRPNARVMTLATPGVRGPILDRNGEPLAVSKVSYYPALKFKQFESDVTREEIIEWGRVRIKKANEIFGTKWDPSDNVLWEHYRFRRWMAMPYTFFVVNDPLRLKVKDQLLEGLVMHPIYQRLYPQGKSAAHIIGYTGIKGKLEVGAINYGDPIFPYTEGKARSLLLMAQNFQKK